MGEELSLARKEEEGQSMLLAITSDGESITTSSVRNKRAKKTNPSKRSKRGEVKDTKTKGKGSVKTKRTHARSPKPARRRRDNQDWEQDRGDEGEYLPTGRSAQQLGIVHPGSYCDDAEIAPHYWTIIEIIDNGAICQCKFCRRHLWLPLFHIEAERLTRIIQYYGRDEGY